MITSNYQVTDRVRSFLNELDPTKRVLIVTHWNTLLAMRAVIERWTLAKAEHMFRHEKLPNCFTVVYDRSLRLKTTYAPSMPTPDGARDQSDDQ